MTHLQEDLALALRAADVADAISLPRFRGSDLRVQTKPDRTPVTDADNAVEDAIRALFEAERPDDGFLGEESAPSEGTGPDAPGRQWIVDPIDGTANFLRGLPVWGTLIALVDAGIPVVGVISMPALGRRWWGGPGLGARTIDRSRSVVPRTVSVSAVSEIGDAAIALPRIAEWRAEGVLDGAIAAATAAWRVFAATDAWSYGLLAEGTVDAVAEPPVSPWDIAACIAVVEGAGGKVSGRSGQSGAWLGAPIASNGHLHETFARYFA